MSSLSAAWQPQKFGDRCGVCWLVQVPCWNHQQWLKNVEKITVRHGPVLSKPPTAWHTLNMLFRSRRGRFPQDYRHQKCSDGQIGVHGQVRLQLTSSTTVTVGFPHLQFNFKWQKAVCRKALKEGFLRGDHAMFPLGLSSHRQRVPTPNSEDQTKTAKTASIQDFKA